MKKTKKLKLKCVGWPRECPSKATLVVEQIDTPRTQQQIEDQGWEISARYGDFGFEARCKACKKRRESEL